MSASTWVLAGGIIEDITGVMDITPDTPLGITTHTIITPIIMIMIITQGITTIRRIITSNLIIVDMVAIAATIGGSNSRPEGVFLLGLFYDP